jgi:hypothetical protein
LSTVEGTADDVTEAADEVRLDVETAVDAAIAKVEEVSDEMAPRATGEPSASIKEAMVRRDTMVAVFEMYRMEE